jgi:hypothetical protein
LARVAREEENVTVIGIGIETAGEVLWSFYVVGGLLWALWSGCTWVFVPGARDGYVRMVRERWQAAFPGERVPGYLLLWVRAVQVVVNTVLWPFAAGHLVWHKVKWRRERARG